ncbi:hypothetical protein Bca101_020039 [Brassica carinata]
MQSVAVGIYLVKMAVSDASDSALFMAFDAEMNNLTNGTGMEDAHCPPTMPQRYSGEDLNIPEETFKEMNIEILLNLFKEVLLSTTVDSLLMSWWKETQEQSLNLPKTLFAVVKLQNIGA